MNNHVIFKSNQEAIEALCSITGARIIIAKGENKGVLNRIKDWLKEKWSGFREIDMKDMSSAFSKVRYNKKSNILEVSFKERGTYQYAGISQKIMENFLNSNSKGKFFNKKIKGKYNYKKVAHIVSCKRIRIGRKLARINRIDLMLSRKDSL